MVQALPIIYRYMKESRLEEDNRGEILENATLTMIVPERTSHPFIAIAPERAMGKMNVPERTTLDIKYMNAPERATETIRRTIKLTD